VFNCRHSFTYFFKKLCLIPHKNVYVISDDILIMKGEDTMSTPLVKEYESGMTLINDVKQLETKGISQDNIYVLAHEEDRTKQVADKADVNTIGLDEQGLGTVFKNVFQSTGDELRNKMQEVGLSQIEANKYEEKLDQGKILLIVKDYDKSSELL
jgi:hypothetical protein